MPRVTATNRIAVSGRVAAANRVASTRTPWYLNGGAPTPIAAYQAIGAASLAASYINLANPGTFNAAPGTAPTWASATGWTFLASSSQYLVTGVVPAAGWSAIIRFSNGSGAGLTLFGVSDTGLKSMYIRPSNSSAITYANGAAANYGTGLTGGIVAVAGTGAYRNGVLDGTMGAWSGTNALDIYIGARNGAGVPVGYISAAIQAFAVYSVALTAAQVATVTAAMSTL